MSNLENLKLTVQNLKRESEKAAQDLVHDEAEFKEAEQKEGQLKIEIPQNEKILGEKKQELHDLQMKKQKLGPKIAEEKRKQAKIHTELTQIALEQNRVLREADARDHGKEIKELQHKPKSW